MPDPAKSEVSEADLYETANYAGVPADDVRRFLGVLKLCGCAVVKLDVAERERAELVERCATLCEQMQNEKGLRFGDRWKTLGSTEISGHAFAAAIRALAAHKEQT